MKKMNIISLIIFGAIIISGCEGTLDLSKLSDSDLARLSDKAVVCNEPYIRFGTSCCLDQDKNNICDKDEQQLTQDEKEKEDNYIANPPIEESPPTRIIPEPADRETNYDLSQYPSFFIQNGKFNGILALSDKADAEEVISISDIAVSLQFASESPSPTIERLDIGATKLASEVSNIKSVNSILVGTACNNPLISEILNNPKDCQTGLQVGVGRIDLYEIDEWVHIIVSGGTPANIRSAATVLANYGDYSSQLKGNSVKVRKNAEGILLIE